PIFINMVESGEASGTLPLVLLRLAEFMEAQVRLRAKILSAMTYPMLMIGIGGLVVLLLFTFVIPKVANIFQSINKKLPWYTELIMNVSFFVKDWWWLLAVLAVGAFLLFRKYIASPAGKAWWDALLLRMPLFGPVVRMIAMSRFASTMATLMNGGVPILNAMNIVKAVVNSVPIAEAITKAQANITEGQSVAEPLRKSGEFPNLLLHMIQIGERTGELPQMLELVSQNYEEQVNNRVERMTTLLQPLMLVVMGVLVGIIVMAIFVPLLELQQIR
ncbi:MAG: type II secretion system F family protein, partial [Bdellovibrionales bacterium]|nr:type II secretion system F family protein [Bdellovibrionales bacterium]